MTIITTLTRTLKKGRQRMICILIRMVSVRIDK